MPNIHHHTCAMAPAEGPAGSNTDSGPRHPPSSGSSPMPTMAA
ncbi:hypothetical protein [uncultured Pseudacidovorax sp.]|nr:hypothetical protein [uncultured Pseudacidovorax sp.]